MIQVCSRNIFQRATVVDAVNSLITWPLSSNNCLFYVYTLIYRSFFRLFPRPEGESKVGMLAHDAVIHFLL